MFKQSSFNNVAHKNTGNHNRFWLDKFIYCIQYTDSIYHWSSSRFDTENVSKLLKIRSIECMTKILKQYTFIANDSVKL